MIRPAIADLAHDAFFQLTTLDEYVSFIPFLIYNFFFL
jgi:hypothetical protein